MTTAKELAAALGVHPSTVTRWKKRGLPREEDGSWNVENCRRWMVKEDGRSKRNPGIEVQIRTSPEPIGAKARMAQGVPPTTPEQLEINLDDDDLEDEQKRRKAIAELDLQTMKDRARVIAAKAEREEFDNALKRGEFLHIDVVRAGNIARIHALKSALFGEIPKLSVALEALDARAISKELTDAYRTLCEAFAASEQFSEGGSE